jgi:ubiquinone/menaquinone biosynthesis C-methylase UbiE
MGNGFTQFGHEGWQRVAQKYDSAWASSTRQFIPPLLNAAEVSAGMSVLDVGCGPGSSRFQNGLPTSLTQNSS